MAHPIILFVFTETLNPFIQILLKKVRSLKYHCNRDMDCSSKLKASAQISVGKVTAEITNTKHL
jgi:hypothetical protein